jgi:hypothetical protein
MMNHSGRKIAFAVISGLAMALMVSCGSGISSNASPKVSPASTALSIVPSRVTGTAPLSVFFDTTQSSLFSDGSYIDATSVWNFDADGTDPAALYRTGNGFVAAHVFEKPGTYRVTVDSYDKAGQHHSATVNVTVNAFNGTTYYVAASGADTNDGSQGAPFLTVRHALSKVLPQPGNNNVRILLNRGDTFPTWSATANTGWIDMSNTNGPVILGSYGDPNLAKPILYSSAQNGDYEILRMGSDWRVMDLAVQSGGTTSVGTRYPGGVSFGGSNSLLYRVEESFLGNTLLNVQGKYNTQAECLVHDFSRGGYSSDGSSVGTADGYGSNDSNALIGNHEYNVSGDSLQHAFRIQGGTRFYVAHNTFDNMNSNYDDVTVRGDSDRIVLYKNTIYGRLSIIPQNRANPPIEHQNHVLVDSNLFLGRQETVDGHDTAIEIQAQDIVIRNNLFSNYATQIAVEPNSLSGDSARVRIYNNTAIGNAWTYMRFASVGSTIAGVQIFNNLFWDDSSNYGYERHFLEIVGGSNLASGSSSDYNAFWGNAWPSSKPQVFAGGTLAAWKQTTGNDTHTVEISPIWLSATPTDSTGTDFGKLAVSSSLKGAGIPAGAYLDYWGTVRSLSHPTIGAFELP